MNLTIAVDDNDRDQCPDQPWTATCAELSVSGVGATRADALRDLADAITAEEDALPERHLTGELTNE